MCKLLSGKNERCALCNHTIAIEFIEFGVCSDCIKTYENKVEKEKIPKEEVKLDLR